MLKYYTQDPSDPEVFHEWRGEPVNGISHPRSITSSWTQEELTLAGLLLPAPADPAPPRTQVVNTRVARVDGVVKYVNETAPTFLASTAEQVDVLMLQKLEGFLNQVVTSTILEEKLSWVVKEVAAEALLNGTATLTQRSLLATEAEIVGETVEELAGSILERAGVYRVVVSHLAGFRRKVQAAVSVATGPADYDAALDNLDQDLYGLMQNLLGQQ